MVWVRILAGEPIFFTFLDHPPTTTQLGHCARKAQFFQFPTFLLIKFIRQIIGVSFSCSNSALVSCNIKKEAVTYLLARLHLNYCSACDGCSMWFIIIINSGHSGSVNHYLHCTINIILQSKKAKKDQVGKSVACTVRKLAQLQWKAMNSNN